MNIQTFWMKIVLEDFVSHIHLAPALWNMNMAVLTLKYANI